MSTFAIFGMTAAVALSEERRSTKTKKPTGKTGVPAVDMSPSEWEEVVQRNLDRVVIPVPGMRLDTDHGLPGYIQKRHGYPRQGLHLDPPCPRQGKRRRGPGSGSALALRCSALA